MQIYIAEGTQQTGPFDLDTIKSGLGTGKYQPSQLAWYEGAPGWEPISKLPGMEAPAAPPPPVAAPPAPAPYAPAPPPSPGAYSPGAYPPAPPSPYPSAPSAPGAYAPPPSYAPMNSPAPYGSVGAPEKKGFWAKVGGALATAGIVLFLLLKTFVLGNKSKHLFDSSSSRASTPSYTSSSAGTPTPSDSSSTPTPVATTPYYNNANQFAAGELHDHYVHFHLNFPSSFTKVSGAKVKYKSDFVEFTHTDQTQSTEIVYINDYYCGANATLSSVLPTIAPKYIAGIHASIKKDNPTVQILREGPTKLNGYAAYEYLCHYQRTTPEGRVYQAYQRYLIVAPPSGSNGVIFEFHSDELDAGIHGADDVGRTPETGAMLSSFAFL